MLAAVLLTLAVLMPLLLVLNRKRQRRRLKAQRIIWEVSDSLRIRIGWPHSTHN
ncbi:hypothetical protein UMZ34_23290 [Halopseudomonas pachastrellae]|nr:hypothetical protein UMZ34_23290 [Halopseudomonas pachastrellae]